MTVYDFLYLKWTVLISPLTAFPLTRGWEDGLVSGLVLKETGEGGEKGNYKARGILEKVLTRRSVLKWDAWDSCTQGPASWKLSVRQGEEWKWPCFQREKDEVAKTDTVVARILLTSCWATHKSWLCSCLPWWITWLVSSQRINCLMHQWLS